MAHVLVLVKEKYFDVTGQELQTDAMETLYDNMARASWLAYQLLLWQLYNTSCYFSRNLWWPG